jgi:hypothetical protein
VWLIGLFPYASIVWVASLYSVRGRDDPTWLPKALAAGWLFAGATLIFLLVASDGSDAWTWIMVGAIVVASVWPTVRLIRERQHPI